MSNKYKNEDNPIHPVTIYKVENESVVEQTFKGLSKREYFAALAMSGIVSGDAAHSSKFIAEISVKIADDLLDELDKTKNI